jgi:acetyl-CoA carboxylase biotin carboxyl carrier protein
MDVDKIEELIRVLEGSPNEELCVQKGDYRVCIKKGAKPAPTPVKKASPPTTGPVEAPAQPKERFITAPMVGIFHVVDGIAQVGSAVTEGQVVGSIESMKLPNDIKSSVAGVVVEALVEDGMPVEYGQPLFRVES